MYVKAKKSLGQNFLVNPHILDKIITASEISNTDTVLEVGPGTGNLTKKLAEKAGQVIAVEKDHRLIENLRKEYSTAQSTSQVVEIIEQDILKFNPETHELKTDNYKIVANIPYYITSHFLKTIFEEWPRPKLIVLMVQKEVAQRILEKPPHTNLLALSVQYYAEPELVGNISKNNFRPIPKIDSAIIKLKPKQKISDKKQTEEIFKIIKIGFSEKRKQLAGTLSKNLHIDKEGILVKLKETGLKSDIRPENLSLSDWQKLAETLFS